MSCHTKEHVMEQAQIFASAWSLVGGPFDDGNALDDAEAAKAKLARMVGDAIQQRDQLLNALEGLLNALQSATTHPAIKAARAAIAAAEQQQ